MIAKDDVVWTLRADLDKFRLTVSPWTIIICYVITEIWQFPGALAVVTYQASFRTAHTHSKTPRWTGLPQRILPISHGQMSPSDFHSSSSMPSFPHRSTWASGARSLLPPCDVSYSLLSWGCCCNVCSRRIIHGQLQE